MQPLHASDLLLCDLQEGWRGLVHFKSISWSVQSKYIVTLKLLLILLLPSHGLDLYENKTHRSVESSDCEAKVIHTHIPDQHECIRELGSEEN